MDIEREAETISRSLSDASGLIVKIRMLEPHEVNREFLTNVYVYAIDPKSNTVVEMEELQEWVEGFISKSLSLTWWFLTELWSS